MFDRFIIATTAQKSTGAQDAVIELNKRDDRKFEVVIHFWEDLASRLQEFGSVVSDFILCGVRAPKAGFDAAFAERHDLSLPTELPGEEYYPDIARLFNERKIEAAEHEISKLPDAENDETLSSFHRYSILRWRAKLALEHLRFDEACRLFMLAYDLQPQREQAKFNRILALEFAHQQAQAFEEAKSFVRDGNKSPVLLSLLIRNAPSVEELAPFRATIDEKSLESEDVNLAMANKLAACDQLSDALRYAELAQDLEPNSAHAHAAIAMASHQLGMQGDWRSRNNNLERAVKEYSVAIELATQDKFIGLIPELLHNRGRVFGFLGNYADASRDFLDAVRIADKPAIYAEEALSFLLSIGDYAAANSLLPDVDETVGESRFLSLVARYNNTEDVDLKTKYVADLLEYADLNVARSVEARFFCVQWYIQLKDHVTAFSCVTNEFRELHPFHANTLLAWIALESGDRDAAHRHAEAALQESSSGAHRQEIEVLARVFSELSHHDKALPLWEQTIYFGVLDDNCKSLIRCAQRLNRHDILLRVCQLRETSVKMTLLAN